MWAARPSGLRSSQSTDSVWFAATAAATAAAPRSPIWLLQRGRRGQPVSHYWSSGSKSTCKARARGKEGRGAPAELERAERAVELQAVGKPHRPLVADLGVLQVEVPDPAVRLLEQLGNLHGPLVPNRLPCRRRRRRGISQPFFSGASPRRRHKGAAGGTGGWQKRRRGEGAPSSTSLAGRETPGAYRSAPPRSARGRSLTHAASEQTPPPLASNVGPHRLGVIGLAGRRQAHAAVTGL